MRDQPSVNGALVANLKRGATVTILETRGNWDRVSTTDDGQKPLQGWVYNSYVQDTSGSKNLAVPVPEAKFPAATPATTPAAKTGPAPVAQPAETPQETSTGSVPERAAAAPETGEAEHSAAPPASPP